jgi:hypothetical protein
MEESWRACGAPSVPLIERAPAPHPTRQLTVEPEPDLNNKGKGGEE